MTGKSHMCFGYGMFVGMCALDLALNGKCSMGYPELAVGLGSCIVGSLAPDIDHPNSKISTSDVGLGLLSKGVCTLTSHRQHTHTLLFCILGGLGAYLLSLATITRANSSVAFMAALITFLVFQLDESTSLSKFSSFIAIGVYFGLPFAMKYIPADLPRITLSIGFAKYVGLFFGAGCLSHLIADCACKEGCPVLWPILPMNKHFRFAYITTGSVVETITATAASVVFVGCTFLLFRVGYLNLPF